MNDQTPREPQTRGLLAHAQHKAQETRRRVHSAIDRLLREQQTINFNTVARAAQVTKSYLYAHQDVRERIEALRVQQSQERIEQQWSERKLRQERTDKTKDVLLQARDRRIKALEEENRQLKAELKHVYGKLYEQV
jgi:Family of unknown function (DUF6262)